MGTASGRQTLGLNRPTSTGRIAPGASLGTVMRRLALRVAAILCLGLLPFSVAALEPTQDKGKSDKARQKSGKKDPSVEIEFSVEFLLEFHSSEARHYAEESKLIGLKPLPPGIRKNLARGKPLPPGIAKRDMPDSFLTRLPSHDDYEWHMAGVDLVLILKADKLVQEIVRDVFK